METGRFETETREGSPVTLVCDMGLHNGDTLLAWNARCADGSLATVEFGKAIVIPTTDTASGAEEMMTVEPSSTGLPRSTLQLNLGFLGIPLKVDLTILSLQSVADDGSADDVQRKPRVETLEASVYVSCGTRLMDLFDAISDKSALPPAEQVVCCTDGPDTASNLVTFDNQRECHSQFHRFVLAY
jgi:hypothetical protein